MGWKRAKDRNLKIQRLREHARQTGERAILVERDEKTGRWRVDTVYSQGTKKFLRHITNMRVRHTPDVGSGSQFKKISEFWKDIR
jgi:hypothetical protein